MKLLQIDSSISGDGSASRQISAAITEGLLAANPDLDVARRDLAREPLPHFGGGSVPGFGPEGIKDEDESVLQQFLDADIVVIGAPMYNFSIPSQLKAWLDRLAVAGKTFRYTAQGPVGLAGGKRVLIASARGGLYAPGTPSQARDFQETYLRSVFAVIGIEDVEIIRAEGLALGPGQRDAALRDALATARSVGERQAAPLAD